ncbi:oxidoreductase [Frondihabitans australicus]|uniref:Hemoglobin n=1 Tax=Frondihabitans australicus TaxID=386892 RepID=A0A495IKL7_9MICO|nr:oxidoreductase [Frondihabitans australicus]RKR75978.1 hemoglobin [Frondihabitans australicus]
MADATSLYEAAGGAEGLLAPAEAWHARCLADPVVSHAFSHPGQHPDHLRRLAAYWGEALGGPAVYSSSIADESFVVRLHSGNGEHRDMDDRAIACFEGAIADVGLDRDAAVGASLVSYFAAATRRLAEHPAGVAGIPDGLPVPRWSVSGPG